MFKKTIFTLVSENFGNLYFCQLKVKENEQITDTWFYCILQNFPTSLELTVRKTRPPLVTVAMSDIQCSSHTTHMFSVKNTSQSKEETENTPTEKTEQVTFDMKQGLMTLSF